MWALLKAGMNPPPSPQVWGNQTFKVPQTWGIEGAFQKDCASTIIPQFSNAEKSCAWAQAIALTRGEGQQKVDTLEESLTLIEKDSREEAFQQARAYIDRAAKASGVSAPVSKTFPNRSKERSDARVDIEIITGRAFVPDSTK